MTDEQTSREKLEYDEAEFYGDLHHLVQPIVGIIRFKGECRAEYAEDRLVLVLGLADLALGEGKTNRVIDLDRLRDLRADHGCGYFQNETEDAKPIIQARYTERLRLSDNT